MGTIQAEQLKIEGNNYFKNDQFSAAIGAYTEAITLCPNVSVYWTNRALCHRRRNDWLKVEEDCKRAIQLDHKSVKAHYMLGLALLRKEDYHDGVKELEKALDLAIGADPKSYIVEEIWQALARAKYQSWENESSQRSWEWQMLKESCQSALNDKHLRDISQSEGSLDGNSGLDSAQLFFLNFNHSAQLEDLERVFNTASEADIPTEVPDYLCCKISLDIFRDPVITPSGITYERTAILDHLKMVGEVDPITRESLIESQLIPNLAIKEAVQGFLEKHWWAYKLD